MIFKNRLNLLLLIIIIIITVNFNASSISAQTDNIKHSDSYIFPITAGTPKWKSLGSHVEMLEVCQVPENILNDMSTEGLIETCLSYPLLGDMLAFNNLQQGFEKVVSGFNGLRELLNRQNAGVKLLDRYKTIDTENYYRNGSLVQKGKHAMKLVFVEILLAQNTVLATLKKNERNSLLKECVWKFRSKQKYPEVYGNVSQTSVAFVMARSIVSLNLIPFSQRISESNKLKRFIEQSDSLDGETLRDIVQTAEKLISD